MSDQIVDALGQTIRRGRPRRIVSLVPSLTETLFAYGLGASVAGITRYCVEPAAGVAALPRVGGTKNPDLEAIRILQPDLVLASMEENRREDVEALLADGLRIYVTLPRSMAEALALLRDLSSVLEADAAAAPLLAELEQCLMEVRSEAAVRSPVRYFCPIWRRPYMTSGPGTYVFDLLRTCGGESIAAGEGRYFPVELDDVMHAGPRVILLPDEPYPFAPRHKRDFLPYRDVPAVANGAMHCLDGKLLTWYGPRSAPGLRAVNALFRSATLRD